MIMITRDCWKNLKLTKIDSMNPTLKLLNPTLKLLNLTLKLLNPTLKLLNPTLKLRTGYSSTTRRIPLQAIRPALNDFCIGFMSMVGAQATKG